MSEDKIETKETFWARVQKVLEHKKRVKDNCVKIAEGLAEEGQFELALILIERGFTHDNSKLSGIEFEFLHDDDVCKTKLEVAVAQHNHSNLHHPERFGGIKNMDYISLAEMTADWGARAAEFGTSLREWVEEAATKRFNFKKTDKVYKDITYFVNLLCDKPFKQKV